MTIGVNLGRNVQVHQSHNNPQIMDGKWGVAESISIGSTTTAGCPAPEGDEHLIARVYNGESAVTYVSFGTEPDAATDTVYFEIPAGAVSHFAIEEGDKCSVVAARS